VTPALVINPADPFAWPFPSVGPIEFFAARNTADFVGHLRDAIFPGHPLSSSFSYWYHLWLRHAAPPSELQRHAQRLQARYNQIQAALRDYPPVNLATLRGLGPTACDSDTPVPSAAPADAQPPREPSVAAAAPSGPVVVEPSAPAHGRPILGNANVSDAFLAPALSSSPSARSSGNTDSTSHLGSAAAEPYVSTAHTSSSGRSPPTPVSAAARSSPPKVSQRVRIPTPPFAKATSAPEASAHRSPSPGKRDRSPPRFKLGPKVDDRKRSRRSPSPEFRFRLLPRRDNR
jgi:hypothetical protein